MSQELIRRVLRLANDAHGLARGHDRDDLAGLLAGQAARWSEQSATVVVAGAQKRGKSRLVNALIGMPGLLPVDADIASETQVSIRRGPALEVTIRRGESVFVIQPGELADYASVLGEPAKRRDVTGVEITVDAPLLDGVRLVDTPGVDSLTLGHRHATVAALGGADALLFAVSAQDQPILRHELDFLAEAATRIHTVAFVLTKVEDSTGWRELLTENRERLARSVVDLDPRVARRLLAAPWLPVSSKLAEAALSSPNPERAAARRERSGFPLLERHLRRWADRRELVRAGGVLALATSALRELETSLRDAAAVQNADEAGLTARKSEVDCEITDLAARRRDRRRLGIDQQLLAREATRRAKALLDGYRRTYEAEIADLSGPRDTNAYAAALPDSLDRSLTAAWTEITAETADVAAAVINEFLRAMDVRAAAVDAELLVRPDTVADIRTTPGRARFDPLVEGLPTVMMAGSTSYLAMTLGATALSPLAPVAIGSVLAIGFLAHKRKLAASARTRTALTATVRETFAAVTADIMLAVEKAVLAWRAAAEQAVDDALTARHHDLERRRQSLGRGKGTGGAAVQDLAATENHLAQAGDLHQALDAALREG
ncbi:dynamin family protein [Actinokineospora enzanensis]|uniref:dynamin family protein n=1 Tax=Actinokineospora enzanensis TaxID=155975 RepID=UPI001469F464|nr:dynamin family protein [Actinokineospora enzanensis]